MDLLNTISTYLIPVIYLVSSVPTVGILKLSLQLNHYSHQKADEKSLGFISFLKASYNNKNERNNNSEADKQLPCKYHHSTLLQAPIALLTSIFLFPLISLGCYYPSILIEPDQLKLPAEYSAVICPLCFYQRLTAYLSSKKSKAFYLMTISIKPLMTFKSTLLMRTLRAV